MYPIFQRSRSCWHCGVPLQRAVKYIGIADVILGLAYFVVMFVHVKEGYEEQTWYYHRRTFHSLKWISPEFGIAFMVAAGIQAIMGFVVYIGASNKSRSICQFYMVTTVLTLIFTLFIFRIYELILVNEFCHELKEEQEVTSFNRQQQPYPQQLQSHVPPPSNGNYMNPAPMVTPVTPITVNAFSTTINQNQPTPIPSTPVAMTHQFGNESQNQYPAQSPYNPNAPPAPPIPSALLPPPNYDTALRENGYNHLPYPPSGLYPNVDVNGGLAIGPTFSKF